MKTIPTTSHKEQASIVLLSNQDVVVCVYTRWLYLASLSSVAPILAISASSTDPNFSDGDSRELKIGGDKDLTISAACFSEKGDSLFVWATGGDHYGYFYRMNGHDAVLVGEVSYAKVPFRSYFYLHGH